MPKGIGRLINIGVAAESTRGTAASSASHWLPFSDASLDEKFKNVTQDEAYGVIEDSVGQFRVKNWAEGTLKVPVTDLSLPLILKAAMGASADSTHSGESTVYDHKATVAESAQHQSLTFFIHDPLSGQDYTHALGVIHKLDLDVQLQKFAELSLSVKALKGATHSSFAPSIATENRFIPQYMTFKYAPTTTGNGSGYSYTGNTSNNSTSVTSMSSTANLNIGMTVSGTGISAGTTIAAISGTTITLSQNATATGTGVSLTFTSTPIALKSFKLSLDANIEDQEVLGSVSPLDFLNKEFKVTGQLEAIWQNESDFKTVALATPNVPQALSVVLQNTDVSIGVVPSHPTVNITLDQVYFTDISRPFKVKDLVYQTIKFDAVYNVSNSEMLNVIVTNVNSTSS